MAANQSRIIANDPRVVEYFNSVYRACCGRCVAYRYKANDQDAAYYAFIRSLYPTARRKLAASVLRKFDVETRKDVPKRSAPTQGRWSSDDDDVFEGRNSPRKPSLVCRVDRLRGEKTWGYCYSDGFEVMVGDRLDAIIAMAECEELEAKAKVKMKFRNGNAKTVCPDKELARLNSADD